MTTPAIQLAPDSRDDLRHERPDQDGVTAADLVTRLEHLHKGLTNSPSRNIFRLHYAAVQLALILRDFILTHTQPAGASAPPQQPSGSDGLGSSRPEAVAPFDRASETLPDRMSAMKGDGGA